MQHSPEKSSDAATLRSYVRPLQSSEQFRRVRVQTVLKAMAPTLCPLPLRGANPAYCITADSTTTVFSRLICSVQTMEVKYALHKLNLTTTKQHCKHLLITNVLHPVQEGD